MQTALIVDDSALARLTLKRFLLKHNLEVFEAECVADCRYWLRHNQHPDVIFMDITMPEVDGFEALNEIRANPETKHLPVIMYSGDTSTEAKQKARDGKATGFLRKPVNEEQLKVFLDKLNERYKHEHPVDDGVQHAGHTAHDAAGETAQAAFAQEASSTTKEVRELRHELGRVNVNFERQQESLTSLKNLMQRQSNDLAHLQNNLQQNEKAMKRITILAISAAALALVGIVLSVIAM